MIMNVVIMTDCGLDGLTFKRPSLVKSQFGDECDLNKIVQRFLKTGALPNLAVRQPLPIQDATLLPQDFAELKQRNIDASNMFERESQELRDFFQNSVERYLDWRCLSDDDKVKYLKDAKASQTLLDSLGIKDDKVPVPPPEPPAPEPSNKAD